jgi:hypothetical protein
MFSWKCPHCDLGILGDGSTDTGINEWMNKAVVLLANGSIIKGDYDNYGRVGGMEITDHMYDNAVMAHDACWRVAGKPDLEEYEGKGSKHDPDQGWGNESGAYNMKEPGAEIDEDRWQAALRLQAERKRRRRVETAVKMLRPEIEAYQHEDLKPEDHYTLRYEVNHMEPFVPTEHRPEDWVENRVVGWYFYDKLDWSGKDVEGIETEEEARALAKAKYDEWAASEEAAAIKTEWRSWQASAHARWQDLLRKEGRYEVNSYKENEVLDRCTYDTVETCDSKKATPEAVARWNSKWEADGFPFPEKDLDDWDTLFSAIGCKTDYEDTEGINLLEESD